MFTGIIQETGKIKRLEDKSGKRFVVISCSSIQEELKKGASIACDGICLTITNFSDSEIRVEVMSETTSKTTIISWYPGYVVNLERAMKIDERLDGHIVQGHVDCVASVLKNVQKEGSRLIEIEIPAQYSPLIVERGSIALNGVSLTIASLSPSSFSVSLVGFTVTHTNLTLLKPGNRVNLEFDIIGKYVNRYLNHKYNQITKDMLREQGY